MGLYEKKRYTLKSPLTPMLALVKQPNASVKLGQWQTPSKSAALVTLLPAVVGLCRTDLRVASGEIPLDAPMVLGHECSAWVEQDPTGRFPEGTLVALNPLLPDGRFIGLHAQGVLCERFIAPPSQLVAVPPGVSLEQAAYLEPVAASMAVLKARISRSHRGVIYHNNRISHLTWLILSSRGYSVDWIRRPPEGDLIDQYDYAVETVFDEQTISALVKALKPGGLLVVKSRQYSPVPLVPGALVAKDLTLQAVSYYDFEHSMVWLSHHCADLAPLLGNTWPLSKWEVAFEEAAVAEARKTFIKVSQ